MDTSHFLIILGQDVGTGHETMAFDSYHRYVENMEPLQLILQHEKNI